MSLHHLAVCRYFSLVLFLSFSPDVQCIREGDTRAGSCDIVSLYWAIHSEDPSSYLAIDHIIIHELKNDTSGLLQLDAGHKIELMHTNISSLWRLNASYPTYVENVVATPSTSVDVLLNVSSDAQDPHKNYFAIFFNKENFCSGKTVHLLEDLSMTVAIVASDWFPVSVNSCYATQLEVSWNPDYLVGDESFVTLVLYDLNGTLVETVSSSGTLHTFDALNPCTEYRICLSTEENHNQVCVTGLTDPLPPTNFTVLRANSSGVTIYWDKPALGKYTSFCLEAHVIHAIPSMQPALKKFTLMQHGKEFTISGLPSCQKVNISMWTVCESNGRKPSRKIFAITATAPSEIIEVSHKRRADGILLFWSRPLMYDVVHIAVGLKLHGFTKKSPFTIEGLQSCTEYEYKLEAFCGKSSSGIVTVREHTGPGSVSELKMVMDRNGTQLEVKWKSLSSSNASYMYQLHEMENYIAEYGPVSAPVAQLTGLRNNSEYLFKVSEKCQGELGQPSSLKFVLYNITNSRAIPVLITWKHSHLSVDLHPKTQQTPLEFVKSMVQNLVSDCFGLKAASVEMFSESSSTKICLTVSFDNESWDANVTTENISENVVSSWTGCFDFMDDKYPSSEIICGSFLRPLATQADEDEVTTRQNASITQNAIFIRVLEEDKEGSGADLLVEATAEGTGHPHPTSQDQTHLESEMSIHCDLEFMQVNLSKVYVQKQVQQTVKLVLNDGSCPEENIDEDYHVFTVLFDLPFCGGQMLVNETHIIFQHHLQNTYDPGTFITRGDVNVIWQCVYLRDKILTAHNGTFTSTTSLIETMIQSGVKTLRFTKKVFLLYAITLYVDDSFAPSAAVNGSVTFGLSEILYIEVKADLIEKNFLKTLVLKVESCWATMTSDPEQGETYYFIQNGCPMDPSFKWLTPEGVVSFSRFSLQMFVFASMRESPIYIHCSSKICSPEKAQDCATECPASGAARLESLVGSESLVNAMISAGPITIRPNSTLVVIEDRLTFMSTSVIITACGVVGSLIIFFFGMKIMTSVLHYQQNRKTIRS